MTLDRRSTIFIIGATGAIGRAVAELFLRKDWIVGGLARNPGDPLSGLHLYIGDAGDYAQLVQIIGVFAAANDGIDLLCICSGQIECGAFTDIPILDQQRMIGSVLGNAVNAVHAGVAHLSIAAPMIVLISSVAARIAVPKFATYSALQSAIEALADGLARELGQRGIRVGVVLVGRLRTASRRPARYWTRRAGGAPEASAYIAPNVEDSTGAMRAVEADSIAEGVADLYRRARIGRVGRGYVPSGVRLFALVAVLLPRIVRRHVDRYAFHYVTRANV